MGSKGYFKRLVGMEENKYIQETYKNIMQDIYKGIISRNEYFYNHADIFCKFSDMSIESFKKRMKLIRSEIEENMKSGKLKEIDKMKMLNDWFVEQEKLLDQHWLRPIDQQCQEMYYLLLQHADKSRSFDARSPEDFRAFLEKIRDNHRVAKSQLEVYSSEAADISVKDSALTTLKEVNDLLRSLKEALNKHLSKIRDSTNKIRKEIDQSYNKLLLYAGQSRSFINQEPEEFKKNLERIEESFKVASAHIENYLSGTDNSEEKGSQAFKILAKNLRDLKEIEKNLNLLFDMRSHAHEIAIEIQQTYTRLYEYVDQSRSFVRWELQEFKKNLKSIRNDHKHAFSYIEGYLSGRDRSEANQLLALEKLEMCLDEIKEAEKHLDIFLLNKLNDNIIQTYNKIILYDDRYGYFDNNKPQSFIEELENMNRRREQAKSAVEKYLIGTDADKKKKYEAFSVLEEIARELDLSLGNEINAKIIQKCNILNKREKYIDSYKKEKWRFKERLANIENQRRDANSKLKPYFSGNGISEEEKFGVFETLEECLEKAKIVEIDMVPLLKDPMIQKVDQGYAELLQCANKSPIFTKPELEQLDEAIVDIKECFSVSDENDGNVHESLKENFDKLSKLERKISLCLRLQRLRNNHIKVSTSIENRLNNMTQVDYERRESIRELLEQNIMNAKNKFEEVKEILIDNTIHMHKEYVKELYLDEYHKNIENLRKQACQLLEFV